jgi:hypothetical protein
MPLSLALHEIAHGVPLSFRRIVDIPAETFVAALRHWEHTAPGNGLHIGHSQLRGLIEHDGDPGACRVEVRLARGRLRSPLRMRLEIGRWSWSPATTVLELIPDQRVRPTAAYFRAGHLLLDSLAVPLLRRVGQAHAADQQTQATPHAGPPPAVDLNPGSRGRYAPAGGSTQRRS